MELIQKKSLVAVIIALLIAYFVPATDGVFTAMKPILLLSAFVLTVISGLELFPSVRDDIEESPIFQGIKAIAALLLTWFAMQAFAFSWGSYIGGGEQVAMILAVGFLILLAYNMSYFLGQKTYKAFTLLTYAAVVTLVSGSGMVNLFGRGWDSTGYIAVASITALFAFVNLTKTLKDETLRDATQTYCNILLLVICAAIIVWNC